MRTSQASKAGKMAELALAVPHLKMRRWAVKWLTMEVNTKAVMAVNPVPLGGSHKEVTRRQPYGTRALDYLTIE
jgi:hypothetical protein